MPRIASAIEASARATASRAGATWHTYEQILRGVPIEAFPLSHFGSGVYYDELWDSPPMVFHLAAHMGPPSQSPPPRGWIAEALVQRMARVAPPATPGISAGVLRRLRALAVGMTQPWAVTILRIFLNLWVT